MKLENTDNLKPNGLTLRQERFIDHYIANGGNGASTARAAGYSERTAKEIAKENLTKPHIQTRILERIAETASLTPAEVVGILTSQMRADITDLFDENDSIDLAAIREKKLGRLIKSITVREEKEKERL